MIELNQEQKEEIIDKIALFFERPPFNNLYLLHQTWIYDDKSEDLRNLLRKALNDNRDINKS